MVNAHLAKIVCKGILNIDSKQIQTYKREGYISEYEIRNEIARINKKTIEWAQEENSTFQKVRKLTLKFIVQVDFAGKKTTQTLIPVINLKEELEL